MYAYSFVNLFLSAYKIFSFPSQEQVQGIPFTSSKITNNPYQHKLLAHFFYCLYNHPPLLQRQPFMLATPLPNNFDKSQLSPFDCNFTPTAGNCLSNCHQLKFMWLSVHSMNMMSITFTALAEIDTMLQKSMRCVVQRCWLTARPKRSARKWDDNDDKNCMEKNLYIDKQAYRQKRC